MALYTFKLIEDGEMIEDDIGVDLPNAEIAFEYACDVVGELMNQRETVDPGGASTFTSL
jgi:hypothetical protein